MYKLFTNFNLKLKKNRHFRIVFTVFCSVLCFIIAISATFLLRRISAQGTLSIAIKTDISRLDPAFCNGNDYLTLVANTFEGLMRIDADGNVVNGQITGYTISEDKLTYTFFIDSKAKWSDGTDVTAHDFVFSWRRVAHPDNNTAFAYLFENIEGFDDIYVTDKFSSANNKTIDMTKMQIIATDSKTLSVKLKTPDSDFLDKCAHPVFSPVSENAIKDNRRTWSTDKDLFESNGAYTLSTFERGSYIIFKKNEHYKNKSDKTPDTFKIYITQDENKAYSYFKTKKIQFTTCLPEDKIKSISKSKYFKTNNLLGVYYLSFNLSKEPLNDVRVRKALTLAVDRKRIVNEIVGPYGRQADAFFSYGYSSSRQENSLRDVGKTYIDNENFAESIKKANELLKEAGYGTGAKKLKFELLYNSNVFNKKVMEAVKSMWESNLGAECTLVDKDWPNFRDMREAGNFIIAKDGNISSFDGTYDTLRLFNSQNNYFSWKNDAYNGTVNQLSITTEKSSKVSLTLEAERILMEEYVVCPIYYDIQPYLVSDKLTNYCVASSGIIYFNDLIIKL